MFPLLNQKKSLGGAAFLLFLFVTLLQYTHYPSTVAAKTSILKSLGPGRGRVTPAPPIPNIVHFVHLSRGADAEPVLEFPFRQFVSIYSAHYYLNPDTIYIHTNLEHHQIEAAINASTTPYVRILMKLPNIVFNHEAAPFHTLGGKEISELAHRSDFVRSRVLKKFGGLYLDDDAYVVRDLKPLRESGFKTIVGKQEDGKICNAVIMAAPNSDLISTFDALQDSIFDGGWMTHSLMLLTSLVHDFSGLDDQVLVMMRDAFYRVSFGKEPLEEFYHVYKAKDQEGEPKDQGAPVIVSDDCRNVTEYLASYRDTTPDTPVIDWRGSYILHGWTTLLKYFDYNQEEMFGGHGGITLGYVLARQSRFAHAVYPAVKNAMEAGLFDGTAEELSTSKISNGLA